MIGVTGKLKKVFGPGWDVPGKILFVLLAISILRIIFFSINYRYFTDVEKEVIFKAFLFAVRIDIAALLMINVFFLLLPAMFPSWYLRWEKILNTIFIFVNGGLLFLSVCDNIYFTYTQRRISYDVIFLINHSFTVKLLFIYCREGWYWLLLLAAFLFWFNKIFKNRKGPAEIPGRSLLSRVIICLSILTVCFFMIRGVGSRPLSPSSALLYFPSKIINLASNTGFNLFYTYYKGQRLLEDKNYFSVKELDKRFPIIHYSSQKDISAKPNIVLFIMESFGRDYLDSSSEFKAFTPFLDSLMRKSLVFTNAFNNGRESTHGLVAILASLPPFMQVPYYHSQYHAVAVRGLGKILNENGYDCSFFLGDVDDSFGFKQFTSSLGINHYYSRKDFGDDRFYNGAWGIHDEKFFLYAADVLAKKSQPFFASIYNVSSHPPYIIPAEYVKQFTIPGQDAARNSISYVDYAYYSFFKKIKHESWFNKTVFVFIADHFNSPSKKKRLTAVNSNEIPFFIYAPGNPSLQGYQKSVVQQLDIVPTILDIAGYNGRYMSFGKSALDNRTNGYAVQRINHINQIIDSSYVLGVNNGNDAIMYLYNYRTDPGLKRNLLRDSTLTVKKMELENQLKAMTQRYNHSFNSNNLY